MNIPEAILLAWDCKKVNRGRNGTTGEEHPELAKHLLRVDIVKDDKGYRAVFKEQGASASQMAAAKILDTVIRLPGMVGEANGAGAHVGSSHTG